MIVEDFYGYVDFYNEYCPFIFKNNMLVIMPSSIDNWREERELWFPHKTNIFDKKRNKWIDKITINGVINDNTKVIFFTRDNPICENACYSYKVEYLYKYNSDFEMRGLTFSGEECNLFLKKNSIIKSITKDGNKKMIYSVKVSDERDNFVGKFRLKNYSVSIKECEFYEEKKQNIKYLITLELSRTTKDLSMLINLINLQKSVLIFCSYRRNINFDTINTYGYAEDNSRINIGNFYILSKVEKEESKNIDKSICFDVEKNRESIKEVYQMISKDLIYTTHICSNYISRQKYDYTRILSILIAFERTYRLIYGDDCIRSNEFKVAKRVTINFLQDQINCNSGKLKKMFNDLKRYVQHDNVNYGKMVERALNDNFDIMEFFIKQRYGVKCARRIIPLCSERLNKIRNDMAHGNLEIKLQPKNTHDIYITEILFYVMLLKKIGLHPKSIQKKVRKLFNI